MVGTRTSDPARAAHHPETECGYWCQCTWDNEWPGILVVFSIFIIFLYLFAFPSLLECWNMTTFFVFPMVSSHQAETQLAMSPLSQRPMRLRISWRMRSMHIKGRWTLRRWRNRFPKLRNRMKKIQKDTKGTGYQLLQAQQYYIK